MAAFSLPLAPSPERNALNRITFGAQPTDVEQLKAKGWKAWVEDQLRPPAGDDPELASYLASQTMFIKYNGLGPGQGHSRLAAGQPVPAR